MRAATALALLVLGAAAIAGSVALQPKQSASPTGVGQKVFAAIANDLTRIQRLEVVGHAQKTTLVLTDGKWGIAERDLYPAQPQKLRAVFSGLSDLRRLEPRTADPTLFARLGVDDPTADNSTATLLRAEAANSDVLAEAILGHRSLRSAGGLPETVYVRKPGETQSWLAEGAIPADADPQSWLVREIADIPRARIASVVVSRGTDRLTFTHTGDKTTVSPTPPGKIDDYRIDAMAQSLEGLTLADVRRGPLPGTPIGSSVVTTTDGLAITVTLNRADKDIWASFAATGPGAETLAPLQGWSYQLPSWREQALVPAPADLIEADAPK